MMHCADGNRPMSLCVMSFSFRHENRSHLTANQRAQFAGMVASQWLSLRLQLIGVAMVTGLAAIAMVEHSHSAIQPSLFLFLF